MLEERCILFCGVLNLSSSVWVGRIVQRLDEMDGVGGMVMSLT